MEGQKSSWIWYGGDFEFYHSLKLHLRRTERSYTYPAFWRLPEPYANVRFKKTFHLDKTEDIRVIAKGVGFVQVNGSAYRFGETIRLEAGECRILVFLSNLCGLACFYIEGENVTSDESWLCDCYDSRWIHAGSNSMYTDRDCDPEVFGFERSRIYPQSKKKIDGGVLYDFGKETFASFVFPELTEDICVYFGESELEAVDTDSSYLLKPVKAEEAGKIFPACGFRYMYVKGAAAEPEVYYEHLGLEKKGDFCCSEELITRIWETAAYTLELNSREFYLDGIKRDRWVWSGDAYQSYFMNRYLYFDEDIAARTITALGGKGEVCQHINTIMDYTFYWIVSVYDHYEMSGDKGFLQRMFPRMREFMDFTLSRLDENGFASGVGDDWIFIDWADIDKTGAVCAEQMLLLRAIEAMEKCAKIAGEDGGEYKELFEKLYKAVHERFWDEEKGAFIDSFESGKRNVTRHGNIFALIFGYVDEEKRQSIIDNVILNDNIPQIKTPYFKFYELEAMCIIGRLDYVLDRLREYWGSMINDGATSFWEEYIPGKPWQEQLSMYGNKYGKSLCHAWGASPLYLIGRYFLGVRPLSCGYETFEVCPRLEGFSELEARVPVKGGSVIIRKKDNLLQVSADRAGGTLRTSSGEYELIPGTTVTAAE